MMLCKNANVWQPWHCTDCADLISYLVGWDKHLWELVCSDVRMSSIVVQQSICLSYHWLNVTISSHQTMKQGFMLFFLKMENRWVWKSDNVGIIGWLRVLQLYFYRKSFTFMNKQYICRFRVCQSCHCYLTCGSVPGPAASCHPLQRLMDRCHFRGLLQKCSPAEIL